MIWTKKTEYALDKYEMAKQEEMELDEEGDDSFQASGNNNQTGRRKSKIDISCINQPYSET